MADKEQRRQRMRTSLRQGSSKFSHAREEY